MARISMHINRITHLPKELGAMTALESFAAFTNQIPQASAPLCRFMRSDAHV
jgi:hypothetical protein